MKTRIRRTIELGPDKGHGQRQAAEQELILQIENHPKDSIMKAITGECLIRELLSDPQRFDEAGRAYDLLQAYFEGFPVHTLRPLLKNEDPFIQRAAIFVASELGVESRDLIDDIIPLLASGDRYFQYNAMEVLAVCCEGVHSEKFVHVIFRLESDDDVLRALVMRLVSRADVSQLEAAGRFVARDVSLQSHQEGLRILAAGESVEPGAVVAMIRTADPLLRRYGAIAAKRLLKRFPILMKEVGASHHADLCRFFEDR